MRGLDMSSPDMTTAEMTRAEVEAALAAAGGRGADFTGKRLSGLDLSGLDLSGANLARGAAQPREPFARESRRGDAGPSLGAWRRSHRRQSRQGEPVRDTARGRASRRRKSHGRARHRRLDRRAPRRRSIRRRGLQRRRKEPVDGPHARDLQIRGSQPRGFFAGQSRAGGLAFRQAFRRQSRRRELARGGRKRRGSARRPPPRRRHVGPGCRFRAHRQRERPVSREGHPTSIAHTATEGTSAIKGAAIAGDPWAACAAARAAKN